MQKSTSLSHLLDKACNLWLPADLGGWGTNPPQRPSGSLLCIPVPQCPTETGSHPKHYPSGPPHSGQAEKPPDLKYNSSKHPHWTYACQQADGVKLHP